MEITIYISSKAEEELVLPSKGESDLINSIMKSTGMQRATHGLKLTVVAVRTQDYIKQIVREKETATTIIR